MSQLQYIGARYVPIWYENTDDQSADWQPNVEYEPLTFVTTTNNHLYLSKKTVPDTIGNPANNISYWLDMGVFTNAQIAQLQQEVNDMKDGSVSGSLQNQINSITSDISDMKDGTVSGSLQNQINDLVYDRSRKYAIITDSYGIFTPGVNTPFTERFRQYMGLTEGVDYAFAYLAGAGFVANTVHFTDVIDSLYANMPGSMTPDDITDFIICGGVNDHNASVSNLETAIENTVSYAKSKFTNAKIYIAVTSEAVDFSTRQDMQNKVVPCYMNCSKYGAYPIQNIQYVMVERGFFQSDGTHPNSDGNKALGAALASAMRGGYTKQYNSLTDFTVQSPAGAVSAITRSHVLIDNNTLRLTLTNLTCDYGSARTVQEGSVNVADFTSNTILGNQYMWGTCRTLLTGGTDNGKNLMLPFFLTNGQIYIVLTQNVNVSSFTIYRMNILYNTLDC